MLGWCCTVTENYLRQKCDYVLLGLLRRGPKRAEQGHKKELEKQFRREINVVPKLFWMELNNMKLPSLSDISPTHLLNLDERMAFQHFFGKSLKEAVAMFGEREYYAEDLGWMGKNAFEFYVKAYIEYLDHGSPDEFDIMDAMLVVMQRARWDDCHENVKLLINKISELKHVSPCGDKNFEKSYDEAVQGIMNNRD
jgi:hypothetical protein